MATPTPEPVRPTDASAGPAASLGEVDIRAELAARPSRAPDPEALERALAELAREMTENPRRMLQKLVETAVDLCNADTSRRRAWRSRRRRGARSTMLAAGVP